MRIRVKVQRLPVAQGLPLPRYASAGAAGADVCAAETIEVFPGQRAAVATGLQVEIPEGYEIQVRPRSGLAFKQGLTVVNAPGTIDSDYRGELKVLLINLGSEPVRVSRGERVAQLVLAPVIRAEYAESDQLSFSTRGGGGFGSTGS